MSGCERCGMPLSDYETSEEVSTHNQRQDCIAALLTELTHLRAKAAAGAKLREAYVAIRDRYECDENDTDHTCEVADRLLNALDAWAAAVGEGGG